MWRSILTHRPTLVARSHRSVATSSASYALRSQIFIPTTREVPADAAIPSHQLLLRGGYMRKTSNGIYMMLPLALRSLAKLEAIIDHHMHEIGCSKLSMPNLLHNELWKETGRWDSSGPELFRVNDRRDVAHCLGPTHEEVFTSLVASTVSSPKALPLRLYQIGRKFRDEIRPRFGLLRAKEFVMKDAYTFDVDKKGAEETYNLMVQAYHAILSTLELSIVQVEADTGNIGGSLSHEFHVLSGFGEDSILACSNCDYAANVEKARSAVSANAPVEYTFTSIDDILENGAKHGVTATFFHENLESLSSLIVVVGPSDRDINPLSLKPHVDVDKMHLVKTKECFEPSTPVKIFIDNSLPRTILDCTNSVHGEYRQAKEHDGCPCCSSGKLLEKRGIEVGHVFYLGDKYSKVLKANYVDEKNKSHPMVMGCYGMGVTRLLAAAVESLHDEHGIVWPSAIAPYQVVVVGLAKKSDDNAAIAARQIAATLSTTFKDDVVLDDRWGERPGLKLTEAELIGYTWRVVVGKRFASEGLVEVLHRPTMRSEHVPLTELQDFIQKEL